MTVKETILDGDPTRYEQRFGVPIGRSQLKFVRRPVSIVPPEDTVCCVDNGPRHGTIRRQTGAAFRDGKWSGCKFDPTHWVDLDDPSHD